MPEPDFHAEDDAPFPSLLEAAFEGVAIHENGVFLKANEALARMFGYPLHELIGLNGLEFALPEYRERILRHMEEGHGKPYEVEGVRRDGTRVHVEMLGHPYRYRGRDVRIAAFRDITRRKEAEAQLLRHGALLDFSQKLAQLGSWEWSLRDHRFACSEEFCRIFGLTDDPGAVPDELLLSRVVPEDRARVELAISAALEEGRPFESQHRIALPDGTEKVIQAHGALELGEDGSPLRFIGAAQDVTERYRLEAMLREQNEQLKELDRLKNGFISAVSHELRTPLASIMGYAEFLEDDVAGSLGSEQRAFVRQIMVGARRLRILVDDLLDFARFESGRFRLYPREADLVSKAREIIDSLQPQAQEARLSLESDLPAADLTLSFDPERVGQVLLNLLGNAIKFTPAGGTIRLALAPGPEEVRFEIRDTGIGIASANLPKLFEKFFQIDPSMTRENGGTGLGLSISKALVEAHGGRIGVESRPGDGATFWFTLPRTASAGGEHPAREP